MTFCRANAVAIFCDWVQDDVVNFFARNGTVFRWSGGEGGGAGYDYFLRLIF